MGRRTDRAAQRVADQRQRIAGMLDDLDERVHQDAHAARITAQSRLAEVSHRASNLYGRIPGSEQAESQITAHPLASMLGGFGAGVALGVSGHGPEENGAPVWKGDSRHGPGMLGSLTAGAASTLAAPLRNEARALARQMLAGILGTDDRPGGEGTRRTAPPR